MKITVITSNISADFLSPPGVPHWEERKFPYLKALLNADPDVIGLQEVTPRQLYFLSDHLRGYTRLGVPVINPSPEVVKAWSFKYERFGLPQIPNPYEIILFYKTDVFDVLDVGHWWLSPTPERPSIGFGNTAPRVVLWAQVRHRASQRTAAVFNTHIDRRCTHAMVNLFRERFSALEGCASDCILMGDLNFNPEDENYARLMEDGWRDSCNAPAPARASTFLYDLPDIPGGRIDHILHRGEGLAAEAWSRILPAEGSPRISDHDPVCTTFNIL